MRTLTLVVPKVNNVTHGGIAFTTFALILWNELPEYIRKIENIENRTIQEKYRNIFIQNIQEQYKP